MFISFTGNTSCFKSILSDINISPTLYYTFLSHIFSHPFSLNLFLGLQYILYGKHIVVSYFFFFFLLMLTVSAFKQRIQSIFIQCNYLHMVGFNSVTFLCVFPLFHLIFFLYSFFLLFLRLIKYFYYPIIISLIFSYSFLIFFSFFASKIIT